MKYPPNFCDNLQKLKGGYNQCYKLAELMLPKLRPSHTMMIFLMQVDPMSFEIKRSFNCSHMLNINILETAVDLSLQCVSVNSASYKRPVVRSIRVSLGKIMNPKLFPPSLCEFMCEWLLLLMSRWHH